VLWARHRFVSDRGYSGIHEPPRLLGIRSEVQIREKYLTRPQPRALVRLWFFDLDDELAVREHLRSVGRNRCSDAFIIVVEHANAGARVRLDEHIVSMLDEFPDAARGQADTVFAIFDLSGYTDAHLSDSACRDV